MLAFNKNFGVQLTNKSLNKKSHSYDVEDKQVENILPVFLQECGQGVPLAHHPHPATIVHLRVHVERRHSMTK